MDDNFCKDSSKLLRQFAESQNTVGLFSLFALNFVFSPVAILGNACYNMLTYCVFSPFPLIKLNYYVIAVILASIGFLLTTFANVRVYIMARYHQNQIQAQFQSIVFLITSMFSFFFVLLNSSINPFTYYRRYREVGQIIKDTLKKIFRT